MKKELHLVLENCPQAFQTLEELKAKGFNATILSGESLRHAVDYYPEEHHFLSLRHIEKRDLLESIFVFFIADGEKIDQIKEIIRRDTGNFHDIKGCMYSQPIDDYEGSI